MIRLVAGQKDALVVQLAEGFLALEALIQLAGDVSLHVGAWRDQVAVHRPVVVFAQGDAVLGAVVAAHAEGDQVGRVEDREAVLQDQPQAAGAALVIVGVPDDAGESRLPHILLHLGLRLGRAADLTLQIPLVTAGQFGLLDLLPQFMPAVCMGDFNRIGGQRASSSAGGCSNGLGLAATGGGSDASGASARCGRASRYISETARPGLI